MDVAPTDAVVERILDEIIAGHSLRAAGGAAGVNAKDLAAWKESVPGFADAIVYAEQLALYRQERRVIDAAADDYRASTWWLERKHAAEWGRQTQVSGKVSVDVVHRLERARRIISTLPQDQVIAIAEGRADAAAIDAEFKDAV